METASEATRPHPGSFADEFSTTVHALRQAFDRLLRALGADPTKPQQLCRRFGLNKNLAWKLSRLVASPDAAAALRFVPGSSGLKILLDVLGREVDVAVSADLATAIVDFESMVGRHAGTRAGLEILVQGLAHERLDPETLEAARRQAFHGNSAIWGVQAKLQMSTTVLYPSASRPGWVDTLELGGLLDFRRIRPDVRWFLFSRQTYDLGDGRTVPNAGEPIVAPPGGPGQAPLLAEFCSSPLPRLDVEVGEDRTRYVMPGGPIGNTAQQSCVYATLTKAAGPATVDDDEGWTELGTSLQTPVEHLQLDVLVHEDLELPPFPEVRLLGRMDGDAPFAERARHGRTLPFGERVLDLGRGLSGLASAQVPRCPEMLAHALAQVGWAPDALRAWRFSMPYPPIPAAAMLALPLPRS